MTRDYRTLDAIVVTACLAEMAFVFGVLAFVTIPQPNLPILSALASGILGATIGAYAGARWGNNKTTTRQGTDGPEAPVTGEFTVTPQAPKGDQ